MHGELIPSEHHVSRYCAPSTFENGKVSGVAFRLREKNQETYLSVNWLEHLLDHDRAEQIKRVRAAFTAKRYRVAATSVFVVLNVGQLTQTVREGTLDQRNLETKHEPDAPDDPSHSGIFGYDQNYDDEIVADLLASVVIEQFPGRGPAA